MFVDSAAGSDKGDLVRRAGFDLPLTMTVQAMLFANGAIEYRFGART